MFDFNSIGIKTTEDLQEALLIKHSARSFVGQVKGMIERWGLESTLNKLGAALCGVEDDLFPIKPLLHFTHEFEETYKYSYDEPRVVEIKKGTTI